MWADLWFPFKKCDLFDALITTFSNWVNTSEVLWNVLCVYPIQKDHLDHRWTVIWYKRCCENCPHDMNNQSIEKWNRAHSINIVAVSQFRGWTLQSPNFWDGCVLMVQQGLSHFKCPTKCDCLGFGGHTWFTILNIPQLNVHQSFLNLTGQVILADS